MATSVDMSLDDLIKSNRSSVGIRGRGRGRGRLAVRGQGRSVVGGSGRMNGTGPRGRPLAVIARPSSYAIAKSIRWKRSFPWQTDLLEDSIKAAGIQSLEIGTKLHISNLDYRVTNEDIRELFSEIGDVRRYAVHYEKTGRPSGSAEVVYTRRSDAFLALKRYNNVLLDGKPMKMEVVGANTDVPVAAAGVTVAGLNFRKKRATFMPGQGGIRAPAVSDRGSGRKYRGGGLNTNGRGRGQGRGRGRGIASRGSGKKQYVKKSAEQLDKELDSYHAEAMKTD